MSKAVYLFVASFLFLGAMTKTSDQVVPFLQPIVEKIENKTEMPLLLPTYWSDLSKTENPFPSVRYKTSKNGYELYFFQMKKAYKPNDAHLEFTPLENEIGNLYSDKKPFYSIKRPYHYVASKKIEDVPVWYDRHTHKDFYAKNGKWTILVHGSKKINKVCLNEMKKVDWLNDKDIRKAKMYVTEHAHRTEVTIVWQNKDNIVYDFTYNGGVKESIKVMNSMAYIN